jgi:hypothetical protein
MQFPSQTLQRLFNSRLSGKSSYLFHCGPIKNYIGLPSKKKQSKQMDLVQAATKIKYMSISKYWLVGELV